MKPLDDFAQRIAEQVLVRHCCCYGDAYPAPSCTETAASVAKAIEGGRRSNASPADLAATILLTHCACHETLRHGAGPHIRTMLATDVDECAATIRDAFRALEIDAALTPPGA